MKITIAGQSHKIRQRFLDKCEWFARSGDSKRLQPIPHDPAGHSAIECFFAEETLGQKAAASMSCREPEQLARLLNGKAWHGVTITHCAEDFIGRILFSAEIKANYPGWVANEIFTRAEELAMDLIGYIPTFIKNRRDFSEPMPA